MNSEKWIVSAFCLTLKKVISHNRNRTKQKPNELSFQDYSVHCQSKSSSNPCFRDAYDLSGNIETNLPSFEN